MRASRRGDPLARQEREEILELETRKRIYQHLRKKAGAYMREIARDTGIPMGTVEYHLHYMTRAGILTTREDDRYTRYFVVDGMDRRERDVLAVIRQEIPRQIAAHLVLHPGATHGDIHEQFDVSASTLSFHLKKLLKAGLARKEKDGRTNRYWLEEPDLVARVIIKHRESFLDDVIDRFAGVWLNLQAREPDSADDAGDDDDGDGENGPVDVRRMGGGLLGLFVRLVVLATRPG